MNSDQRETILTGDDHMQPGHIGLLRVGNQCQLLDGRRTPGVIEDYDAECAMFIWRITDYEDQGAYWEVPAEEISSFQFPCDARENTSMERSAIQEQIDRVVTPLEIIPQAREREGTLEKIHLAGQQARKWLINHSEFLSNREGIDFDQLTGPLSLRTDFQRYMRQIGLWEIEKTTASHLVLNPHWWEWIKGMKIVLAEMGLAEYRGKVPRKADLFQGKGSRKLRQKYLVKRMGFLKGLFNALDIDHVVVYRGMSTEKSWQNRGKQPFSSWTFNMKVAERFASFERKSPFLHAYLIKRTIPVSSLLMTYLETSPMNDQYLEAEAIVLNREVQPLIE